MASKTPTTDTALLDSLVLQHLKERGFAEVATSLEAELAKQKKPRGQAATALVVDASRPALVQLLNLDHVHRKVAPREVLDEHRLRALRVDGHIVDAAHAVLAQDVGELEARPRVLRGRRYE